MTKTILTGHTSPETAYVVNDYPYGFRLRCKIRYWLECNKKGVRLASQTTNPKSAGHPWNKPKASGYAPIAAAMYLDDENHVTWSAIRPWATSKEAQDWLDIYIDGVPEPLVKTARVFVKVQAAREEAHQRAVAA